MVWQPAADAGRDLGEDRQYGSGVRHAGVDEYVKECLPAWTQVVADRRRLYIVSTEAKALIIHPRSQRAIEEREGSEKDASRERGKEQEGSGKGARKGVRKGRA